MNNAYNAGSILFNMQKFRTRKEEDEEKRIQAENGVENKRSFLDRSFDALSVGQYATMGALKGIVDKDTSVIGGFLGGLRAGNPFGKGYDEGEHSFSDVLEESGFNPTSTTGKILKGSVGFLGDVFLDPLTYVAGPISGLVRGSGKFAKVAKKSDMLSDMAKGFKVAGDFKSMDDLGSAIMKRNFDELIKRGVDTKTASKIAKERIGEVVSEGNKLLSSVDNGMDLDRALEIANRTTKFTSETEAVEYATKLMDEYNSLHGIRGDYKGLELSLANAPFGKKIFGKYADKGITLVSPEKMLKYGDEGLAPTFHKVRDSIYKRKIGKLFNINSNLYKISQSNPDGLFQYIKYQTVSRGLSKEMVKSRTQLQAYAKELGLDDLTPADNKAIIEMVEDKSRLKTFYNYSKLIESEEGQGLLEDAFKRENEVKIKLKNVRKQKAVYDQMIEGLDSKIVNNTEEFKRAKESIVEQIKQIDFDDLKQVDEFSSDELSNILFDMPLEDAMKMDAVRLDTKSFLPKTKQPIKSTRESVIFLDETKKGNLAGTTKDGQIYVKKNVSRDTLLDYIKGNSDTASSQQKKTIFDTLSKEGYDVDEIGKIIETDEDVADFLIAHENSHKINKDADIYFKNGSDLNTPDKLEIEKRSIIDALEEVKQNKLSTAKTNSTPTTPEEWTRSLWGDRDVLIPDKEAITIKRSSFKNKDKFDKTNIKFQTDGYVEYSNRASAKALADYNGFEVVKTADGKFRVQPSFTSTTPMEATLKGNRGIMSKEDMIDSINVKMFDMTDYIHSNTYESSVDELLDIIKKGGTPSDVQEHIMKYPNRFNGKGALIDPFAKKEVGGFGGFNQFEQYQKTISKVFELRNAELKAIEKSVRDNLPDLFRKKHNIEGILNTPSGNKMIDSFVDSGFVEFKNKQSAETLAEKLGFGIIDIKKADGKMAYRVVAPDAGKTGLVDELTKKAYADANVRRTKVSIDSYSTTGKSNLRPDMSVDELKELLADADYEALIKEYTLKASRRSEIRDRLLKMDLSSAQMEISQMKAKELEMDVIRTNRDMSDIVAFKENLEDSGIYINRKNLDIDSRTADNSATKIQKERSEEFIKSKDEELLNSIKAKVISEDPELSIKMKDHIAKKVSKRTAEIKGIQQDLRTKVKREVFATDKEYYDFMKGVNALPNLSGESIIRKSLKLIDDPVYRSKVKITVEEQKVMEILQAVGIRPGNSYKTIKDFNFEVYAKMKPNKEVNDTFDYIKNALESSGRNTVYDADEMLGFMKERKANTPFSKTGTISQKEYLDNAPIFDDAIPMSNPINAEAVAKMSGQADELLKPETISEIMEEIATTNFTKLKTMDVSESKKFFQEKQDKLSSLQSELKNIEDTYSSKLENLETMRGEKIEYKTRLDDEYIKYEEEIRRVSDQIATDEAKADFIRLRVGEGEYSKLIDQYDVVRHVLDDTIDMDTRLVKIAESLKEKFRQMGLNEMEVGKLNRTMEAYIPHILTPEGHKFFTAVKDKSKIIKKFPGWGTELGYGRVWNPHNMARTSEGRTILELNEFFKAEYPDLVKGNNVFSEELSTIFLSRAKKNTELIYDNHYMNNMFDMFGEKITDVSKIDPFNKDYKSVVNYGVLKERINFKVNELVSERLKEITRAGNKASPEKVKSIRIEETEEIMKALGFPKETLFDLATPMIEVTPEQLETLLNNSFVDDIAYRVSSPIVDDANRMRKSAILKQNNKFLKLYDKFTHFIKLNQTTIMPGFHFRNKYGNAFNSWLTIGQDAYNLDYTKKTMALMKNGTVEGTLDIKNLDGTFTKMEWNDVYRSAQEYGIIDEGFYEKDLGVGSATDGLIRALDDSPHLDPTRTKEFFGYKFGAKVGTVIEGSDRLIHYASQLSRGASPEQAMESVYKTLFDYGSLTQFERDVMKRIFPYYTWMRKNAPYQIEMMLEQPEKYRLVSKVVSGITNMNSQEDRVEDRYLADFAKDFAQTPFRATNQYGEKEPILWNPSLPYQDVNRIPDPFNAVSSIRELASQMNPLLKVPIEQALNQNFFFNSEIVREGDNQLSKRAIHIISQFPAVNALKGAFEKEDADLGLHVLNQASGVKFSAYNYEAYKRQQIKKKLGIDE